MIPTTPRGYKLGKLDPVPSPFADFKTYLHEAPPAPPSQAHYGHRVTAPWQMDGNGPDTEVTIAPEGWPGCGDCVEAGKAHALLTANYYISGGQKVPEAPANAVVEQYCAYQGCTTAELFSDPSQWDNGEDVTNSLLGWTEEEEHGVKLAFTAPVDVNSKTDIMNGIFLGGGLLIGIQLPQSAEEQFPNKWEWDPSSPILGGHCVWLTGYAEDYVALVTWGQLIQCSWEFLLEAIDEAHTLVLPQSIAAGTGPTGLQIAKWESDLNDLNA